MTGVANFDTKPKSDVIFKLRKDPRRPGGDGGTRDVLLCIKDSLGSDLAQVGLELKIRPEIVGLKIINDACCMHDSSLLGFDLCYFPTSWIYFSTRAIFGFLLGQDTRRQLCGN